MMIGSSPISACPVGAKSRPPQEGAILFVTRSEASDAMRTNIKASITIRTAGVPK